MKTIVQDEMRHQKQDENTENKTVVDYKLNNKPPGDDGVLK